MVHTPHRQRLLHLAAVVSVFAVLGALASSVASSQQASFATPARVLVVTHTAGFRHTSIPTAEATLEQLGAQTGRFGVELCRNADDVKRMTTSEGLSQFDVVVFANTTGNLGIPDLAGFLDWVRAGHGVIGAHSASDTYHDEPRFIEMMGGEFREHGKQAEVEVVVENREHPAVAHFPARFRILDEIYMFKKGNRGEVTMLLSLDRRPMDGLPNEGQPADLPLAWSKSYGAGRVFYTALGHREDVWENPAFRQHLAGGIGWVLNR